MHIDTRYVLDFSIQFLFFQYLYMNTVFREGIYRHLPQNEEQKREVNRSFLSFVLSSFMMFIMIILLTYYLHCFAYLQWKSSVCFQLQRLFAHLQVLYPLCLYRPFLHTFVYFAFMNVYVHTYLELRLTRLKQFVHYIHVHACVLYIARIYDNYL